MSTALAIVSRGAKDEIGNLVDENLCAAKTCLDASRVAKDALPMERGSLNGRFGNSTKYDADLVSKYPVMDLNSVLGMLHKKKIQGVRPPRFAVYNAIGDGTCGILIEVNHTQVTVGFGGHWPKEAGQAYNKVVAKRYANRGFNWAVKGFIAGALLFTALPIWLACSFYTEWLWLLCACPVVGGAVAGIADSISRDIGTKKVTLTAFFKGLVPEETRDKIKDHMIEKTFEQILIIQEVEKWESEVEYERPPQVRIDPLVVGMKNGIFYMLDRFDTTTLEEYVSREFCTDESAHGTEAVEQV